MLKDVSAAARHLIARGVPLLLIWLWLAACSAPAPAGSAPAAPAAPAAAAKPMEAPAATVAAPATASASAVRPTVAPLNPPVPVKVGVTGIAPEAAIYQAVERGYFQEEGLDVELVSVRGITEQVGLLATGQLHFGNGGVDPGLFNAAQRDIGLKLVTTLVSSTEKNPGAAGLIVRKERVDSGQYRSLSDLKGLTIAVSALGTTSQMHVEKALTQGGLTVDDVNMVAMAFPDMLPALGNKAIDAAWEVEPFMAIANSRGIATTTTQAGDVYPGALGVVMLISPQFAADHQEAARRYLTAFLRGTRDYYRAFVSDENPAGREEFYQVLMKHTPVKDPTLYPLLGWSGVDPNGGLDERRLAEMQDYLFQRGTIKDKLDVSRVVDHSYANYAVERLGRYPQ
jgi:NitT/TauT family transport system substrate-binding protein